MSSFCSAYMLSHHPRFVDEAFGVGWVAAILGLDDFDGHRTFEFDVFAVIDGGHAAVAQHALNAEVGQLLAD
ncbi:MAG: hypothetical protein IT310_05910 [Anaerolineales bacterium]|nr:hypothetical protein [Anaerolineales bacterium]